MTQPITRSVAAVDLGSNSFHLLVARADAGQLTVVDRLREMVQLAAGLSGEKMLSRKACTRALECLERFGQRLKHMPDAAVRAVGTNTLRSARNIHEFQQHHKHGEYIVRESDMFGFSREEQRRLATLVRAHRRKFPATTIRQLPHGRRDTERLAALLRLAVLLHRSRNPAAPPESTIEVGKKSIRLEFPAGWLDGHPLTYADLNQERIYLKAAGIRLDFD